jgi:hypothetical protein
MGRYGVLTVGRLPLREDFVVTQNNDLTLSLTGQESSPLKSLTEIVERRRVDIMSLQGKFVPVLFEKKPEMNGYYWVSSAQATVKKLDPFAILPWQMTLIPAGPDNAIDIESRLSGALTRQNSFAATGNRTQAPPIGSYAYHTETTALTAMTRANQDGTPITVYRSIPAGINPRFGCAVEDYSRGRVKFLDQAGRERVGTEFMTEASSWEINNGTTRVRPAADAGIEVSSWVGGAWVPKKWLLQAGGVDLHPFDQVTVLRNDFEIVVVRLLKHNVAGRRTVDISLRRGARVVELYLQRSDSGTLAVKLHTIEAGTATSGYITANANDADGHRYIVGSATTFTGDAPNGGISVAAQVKMDAFVGLVVAGDTAVSGDAASDLYAQYLGMPAEFVQGVIR